MATVVNNPPQQNNSGMSFILGAIIIIGLAILFFLYILPYLRATTVPQAPQVTIPSQVDVNIKQQ